MIDDPLPTDWKELQIGVRRTLRNVGMMASIEAPLHTPRGLTTVDVFAIDVSSVDQIRYVVECKNWGTTVPQSVVHSFTTVMHETGGNIGFIISKHGLQSGAEAYTQNTNIVGMTYLDFQKRYFGAWWNRYFCPLIGNAADRLLQYTEDFNTLRDQKYNELSLDKRVIFDSLRRDYEAAAMVFSMFNIPSIAPKMKVGSFVETPKDLDDFRNRVLKIVTPNIYWHCKTFRGLLEIMLQYIEDGEKAFNELFGEYVFDLHPISDVTLEGRVRIFV